MTNAPALPTGRELHAHARASRPSVGNSPPEAFVYRAGRIEAVERELAAEREAMRELVREAHEQGVGLATLARWSGYTHGWIARIIEDGGES